MGLCFHLRSACSWYQSSEGQLCVRPASFLGKVKNLGYSGTTGWLTRQSPKLLWIGIFWLLHRHVFLWRRLTVEETLQAKEALTITKTLSTTLEGAAMVYCQSRPRFRWWNPWTNTRKDWFVVQLTPRTKVSHLSLHFCHSSKDVVKSLISCHHRELWPQLPLRRKFQLSISIQMIMSLVPQILEHCMNCYCLGIVVVLTITIQRKRPRTKCLKPKQSTLTLSLRVTCRGARVVAGLKLKLHSFLRY